MITRLKVKNYRSIEEIDLTLSPLTVLVGKNGAGKSTILDVLRFVRDALSENLEIAIKKRGGINSVFRWTPNDKPPHIEILVEFDSVAVTGRYTVILRKTERNGFAVKYEECLVSSPVRSAYRDMEQVETSDEVKEHLFLPSLAKSNRNKTVEDAVLALLTNTEFYNILPDNIRYPQLVTYETRFYGDGSNIGEVLSYIAHDENVRVEFCQMLGFMIDGVEDFRVTDTEGFYIAALKHCHRDGEPWFSLAHESEGTLKALAFLAALYQEHTHTLIAVEEPDANLYQRAIGGIKDVLREGVLRRQIIITTQSPDLLTHFGVDEMRIVEKINGITYAGIIDDRQRGIIEDEIFGAGDLLRVEGMYRKPIVEDEVAAVA